MINLCRDDLEWRGWPKLSRLFFWCTFPIRSKLQILAEFFCVGGGWLPSYESQQKCDCSLNGCQNDSSNVSTEKVLCKLSRQFQINQSSILDLGWVIANWYWKVLVKVIIKNWPPDLTFPLSNNLIDRLT